MTSGGTLAPKNVATIEETILATLALTWFLGPTMC